MARRPSVSCFPRSSTPAKKPGSSITSSTALAAAGLRVHQLLPGGNAGNGEARRDALGEDQDVGVHALMLHGEHLAGAPASALNLVGDEEQVVPVAELADLLHETRRVRNVTALSQDRLDDHGRSLIRTGLLLDQELQAVHCVADRVR